MEPTQQLYVGTDMKLTKIQQSILDDTSRFKIIIAGRRGGKSYASIASLAKHARYPNKKCMYIAPTYRMAKQIIWEDLKQMLREVNWLKKINESELTVTLVNSSTIMLRSADNPDSIRGVGLDYVVIDEAADIPKLQDTWQAVIRPTLSDRNGHAMIISSPKGKGFLYTLYNDAKHLEDWSSWQYTTAQGGLVTEEELAQARLDMDERTYKQEYEAQFVDYAGRIYYAFDDHNITDLDFEVDGRVPVHVGMDFNISPLCAVIAHQHLDGLHIYDEIEIFGTDTETMAKEIQQRYPGRRIICYPDASGAQRRTSAGGRTDHIILKNCGFQLKVGSVNPSIKDRIASVNAACKSVAGISRLTISPKCSKIINALRKHVYAEGTRTPEKHSGLDHLNDALGYMVNNLYPVKIDSKGKYNVRRTF